MSSIDLASLRQALALLHRCRFRGDDLVLHSTTDHLALIMSESSGIATLELRVAQPHGEHYCALVTRSRLAAILERDDLGAQVRLTRHGDELVLYGPAAHELRPRAFYPRGAHDHVNALELQGSVSTLRLPARMWRDRLTLMTRVTAGTESRARLNRLYIDTAEPGSVRLVFTDGHRLAALRATLEAQQTSPADVSIHRSALTRLKHLLRHEQDVLVRSDGHRALIEGSSWTMGVRAGTDESYPDWRGVLPARGRDTLWIDRAQFQAALHELRDVVDRSHDMTIVDIAPGRCALRGTTEGSASFEVDAEGACPDLRLGFNRRYLLEFCGITRDPRLGLTATEPLAPVLFLDPRAPEDIYVLMPMRID